MLQVKATIDFKLPNETVECDIFGNYQDAVNFISDYIFMVDDIGDMTINYIGIKKEGDELYRIYECYQDSGSVDYYYFAVKH